MTENEIKALKETFNGASKAMLEYFEVLGKVAKDCDGILETILSNVDGNRVEIEEENAISVSYDGGNHPEYASDCFPSVKAVYLKNGEIYLDIDGCDAYPISKITTNELLQITEIVIAQSFNNF